MNKISLALILFVFTIGTVATSLQSRQANAGITLIVIGAITDPDSESSDDGSGRIPLFVPGTIALLIGGVIGLGGYVSGSLGVAGTGYGLMILGADGSLPQDRMAGAFAVKYPFIDDPEVIRGLATTVTRKFKDQKKIGDTQVHVSLAPDETQAILAPANMSKEQEHQVVIDLM